MIGSKIPVQNFEIVRDKLAAILHNEFINQVTQFYNTKCANINIYADRTVPLSETENAAIIISTYKGTTDLVSVGIVDGPIEYFIRIMANSPTRGTVRGDKLAGMRLQELVGIVRYIFMHPVYVNLGLPPGVLSHVPEITKFQIDIPDINEPIDTTATTTAHLILKVYVQENANVTEGPLFAGNDTDVRIDLTEQGYKYNFEP